MRKKRSQEGEAEDGNRGEETGKDGRMEMSVCRGELSGDSRELRERVNVAIRDRSCSGRSIVPLRAMTRWHRLRPTWLVRGSRQRLERSMCRMSAFVPERGSTS